MTCKPICEANGERSLESGFTAARRVSELLLGAIIHRGSLFLKLCTGFSTKRFCGRSSHSSSSVACAWRGKTQARKVTSNIAVTISTALSNFIFPRGKRQSPDP
jgi:hypothetical protein